MTTAELIAIIIGASSLVTSLSVLYSKLIKPIKKVIKQVEENTKNIDTTEEKISKLRDDRTGDNSYAAEVNAIIIESLIAVLDGLEQNGANHIVTAQKKKLISFLSKQVKNSEE